MSDTEEDIGVVGPPDATPPAADPTSAATGALGADRESSRRELAELADGWQQRLAEFDATSAGETFDQRSLWGDAVRRFLANRIAVVALCVLVLFALLSLVVPAVADLESARSIDYSQANKAPSMQHPFGTDPQGRDMWIRAWLGGRISLSISFAVALMILLIGVVYGSISGYVGGKLDMGFMRFLDSLYGLPYLPFAIIFVTYLRERLPGANPLVYMVPALSLTAWFTAARIVRSQVLSLKENEYVDAARSAGARWHRIISRHIMPNTLGIMVVAIFLEVPNAILGEATLSFLGLGVVSPDVSWGLLANNGYQYIEVAKHLVWVPGLLIAITVLCAVAVADGLRDALDPRGRTN